MTKKILIILLVILVLIQLYNPNENLDNIYSDADFTIAMVPPDPVKRLIKNSCYDCHSNYTRYPWYSYIAPISYLINHHVEEGKSHLNFSTWRDLSPKKKHHKIEEMIEELEEDEMPLFAYATVHKSYRLSSKDKSALIEWLSQIKTVLDMEDTTP